MAKCQPSRGCCADKKDKRNHNKPAESSDSRLVFITVFDYAILRMAKLLRIVEKFAVNIFFGA